MATFTEHYDLIKPGTDDYYDVADFNENMDAIDTQLYQAEQDMAGVSEKIGNPGDEGEDTLFGLLNPGNQPEEKADFYRYSKTEIKKQIQNWKPNLSGSTTFYGKLTTFRAEKNGTVYVKWTSSDTANGEFYIYHKAPLSILEAPDQSELGSSIPKGLQQEDFCYYHINYVYSSNKGNPTTFEWVFPVIAGIDYTFMWYASSASSLYLNEFSLGYTDTKEA